MNKLLSGMIGIPLLSLMLLAGSGQKAQAQDVTVSYQDFYDNLSPYGQWVYDPQYGNVWVPNEGGDFRPYGTRGHWVMTDYGNTWVSDDPWGWACYHYGRWTYDPYYGWVWIPGYEWAPAWVSWRYGSGYCGWAPLGPGVSVAIGYNCPDSWWVFVGPQYMYRHDCYSYWRGPSYNTTYIHQTTIVNNYYVDNSTHVRYNYGPHREDIERETHQPVQVYRVSQSNRPGAPVESGNRLNMYRPSVNRNSVAEARPANVIQAPRSIATRPQPATNINANSRPQFHQDLPRYAPQQQTQRQAPQQQQRQAPQQQQTQRQAAQQQPQRFAPQQQQQQPQRQAPQQQQPQRLTPQEQPQRQAPQRQAPQQQEQPQRQAPQHQPQRQAPQQQEQPQRQVPQQQEQPQRQAPQQQQPQRQAPQQQRQAPQQQQWQRPQEQPQRQAPQQQQPQRQAPQQQPQRQAPQQQQRQAAQQHEGRR